MEKNKDNSMSLHGDQSDYFEVDVDQFKNMQKLYFGAGGPVEMTELEWKKQFFSTSKTPQECIYFG